ncbi:MAG: hypothetical protein GHCLOJNM_00541 [bacterium]|nr:hypothetical protein [bacterium]
MSQPMVYGTESAEIDLTGSGSLREHVYSTLSSLKQSFRTLYGPRLLHLVLFGSQARGDAIPGSDLDVLVVLRGKVHPGEEIEKTSQLVAELSLKENLVISCLFMDENRFLHRQGPLLRNIRQEGKEV